MYLVRWCAVPSLSRLSCFQYLSFVHHNGVLCEEGGGGCVLSPDCISIGSTTTTATDSRQCVPQSALAVSRF